MLSNNHENISVYDSPGYFRGRAIFSPFKAISGPGRTFTRADLFQALLGLYMAPGRAISGRGLTFVYTAPAPGYFAPALFYIIFTASGSGPGKVDCFIEFCPSPTHVEFSGICVIEHKSRHTDDGLYTRNHLLNVVYVKTNEKIRREFMKRMFLLSKKTAETFGVIEPIVYTPFGAVLAGVRALSGKEDYLSGLTQEKVINDFCICSVDEQMFAESRLVSQN